MPEHVSSVHFDLSALLLSHKHLCVESGIVVIIHSVRCFITSCLLGPSLAQRCSR